MSESFHGIWVAIIVASAGYIHTAKACAKTQLATAEEKLQRKKSEETTALAIEALASMFQQSAPGPPGPSRRRSGCRRRRNDYDMDGNVSEWRRDWYDASSYAKAEKVYPESTMEAKDRVFRDRSGRRLVSPAADSSAGELPKLLGAVLGALVSGKSAMIPLRRATALSFPPIPT